MFTDMAYIANGGTVNITQSESCNSLIVGYTGLGTGHVNMTDGILNTYISGAFSIGLTNDGTFDQSGGSVGTGFFTIGGSSSLCSGVTGTYHLSGNSALTSNSGQTVGQYGIGKFTQDGGSNHNLGIILGSYANSFGTYTLNDGSVSAASITAGVNGTGTFNQNGGAVTISSDTPGLNIASQTGSTGAYNLYGGMLTLHFLKKGNGNASFNFGGGTLQAGAAFTSSLDMNLNGIGSVVGTLYNATVDTAGVPVTLSGILSGVGGLNKLGSGTLTLSASNSYNGNTFINAGKLSLTSSGSIGSTPIIDILSGATFDLSAKSSFSLGGTQTIMGSGNILGNVIASSGSHVSPGNSAGTLTLAGNLTLNDGALLDFELASTSNSDMISMSSSTLYLNNQDFFDFNFTALSGFGQGTYTLIDAGTISGDLGNNLTGTIGDYSATLSKSGSDLILTVVPEPGTCMLLAAACLGLFVVKRMGKK
jgi:autotransporter-associated beta strand protein